MKVNVTYKFNGCEDCPFNVWKGTNCGSDCVLMKTNIYVGNLERDIEVTDSRCPLLHPENLVISDERIINVNKVEE